MTRLSWYAGSALAATITLTAQATPHQAARPAPAPPRFTVVEATIPDMRAAMEQGRVTSRDLVVESLTRIAMYEEQLNAVFTVNPRALEEADARDRERREGRIRGPLHGIPIALKDNIHTTDMPTTGGALAFRGLIPPYEATLTKNLRDAGAIIIAKTVLTELANWVAGGPTPMPGNYSALGGFGLNPYDPRPDPRDATADGRPALSILSPSNQNMLVGIKPTVGRVSRYGVIPITADQDTAGPMARTVTDAAIMLGVLESATPDPNDPATKACTPPPNRDYTPFLKRDALRGARIGIPRAFYYDETKVPGRERPAGGLNKEQAAVMDEAIAVLKAEGAIIVDPADIPSVLDTDPSKNIVTWGLCSGANGAKGKDANCSVVLKYGMKRDFDAWLASLGAAAPLKTLTDLRVFNLTHTASGAIRYGQSNLDISDEMDVAADRQRYEADRAKDVLLGGTNGIDAAMKAHALDALLFPGASGAAIAARPGYPTVIVPFGMVPNAPTSPFPAGFDAKPGPFGVSFTGMACSEPRLIELAYAFEQATKRRVPPPLR